MTHNQIEYWNLQENKRHNTVTEAETGRHNVVTENETQRHNVETEEFNISQLQETQRHNISTEAETNRHNIAAEVNEAAKVSETKRHNVAAENLSVQDLNIRADQLVETKRHNQASERLQRESNAISSLQQQADQAYKEATALTDKFNSLNKAGLTAAQTRQAEAQIKKLNQDVAASKAHVTQENINTIINGAKSVANLLDALIPF